MGCEELAVHLGDRRAFDLLPTGQSLCKLVRRVAGGLLLCSGRSGIGLADLDI
jgi:hypothetical protein